MNFLVVGELIFFDIELMVCGRLWLVCRLFVMSCRVLFSCLVKRVCCVVIW